MACQGSLSFVCGILAFSRLLGLGLAGAGAPCPEEGICSDEADQGIKVLQHKVAASRTAPSYERQMSPRNQNATSQVPACKGNRDTWDAGWGLCETYDESLPYKNKNHDFCSKDRKHKLLAAEVCSECGLCKQVASIAPVKVFPQCAKILGAKIDGHNTKLLKGVTVENCTRACFGEGWCKSFDFTTVNGQGVCDLSDKSAADVGGLKHYIEHWDHYACESIASFSVMSMIPTAGLPGKKLLTSQTVESCSLACLNQSWCKSFNWLKHKNACVLCDKSASDNPMKFDYTDQDHYPVVRSTGDQQIMVFPQCAKIPGAKIVGHNTKLLKGVTVEDCTRACFGEGWCKSFDFTTVNGQGVCHLSDKSAADVGGLKHYIEHWDHYACESIASFSVMSMIPTAGLPGKKLLTSQTVESCSLACLNQSWCKSFKWLKHKNECVLCDKSASDNPMKFDYTDQDLYPVVRSTRDQ